MSVTITYQPDSNYLVGSTSGVQMSASETQLDSFLQYYRQKLSNTANHLLISCCLDTFEGERFEWQQEAEKLRMVLERIHS